MFGHWDVYSAYSYDKQDRRDIFMELKRLAVKNQGIHAYDIVIGESFEGLAAELKTLHVENRRVCIVTESRVSGIYLDQLLTVLTPICREISSYIFPEGEKEKNLHTVSQIYGELIQREFDRKDLLIALGGGVTGDLTGFTAATYLRGIDFVQVPTSLLSQVDSSIGGKTGVDYDCYKNMVGAFYMPKLVYINTSTLQTLSERQFISGMGEVIKHGLIRDKKYYEWIRCHIDQIMARENETLADMVEWSCRIKRAVVEEDPREKGIRACLNYGHTLGHAIEKLMDFRLTHGECVGIGTVIASYMSRQRGYLTQEEYQEIRALYDAVGFPGLPKELEAEQIVSETRHDKKMEQGRIKFILLKELGQAEICQDVTEEEMLRSIQEAERESL